MFAPPVAPLELQRSSAGSGFSPQDLSAQEFSNDAGPDFRLCTAHSTDRGAVEAFVAERFRDAYGAEVQRFFPLLLNCREQGQLASVLGLRPGLQRPLFLEQYLDASLEAVLVERTGTPISRRDLMEIGNLASISRPLSRKLFILLTEVLYQAGYQRVVFTATEHIRLLLKRLRFVSVTLCDARPERLPDQGSSWGSYYAANPEVQAGNVSQALSMLRTDAVTAAWLDSHKALIKTLADELVRFRTQEWG